MDEMVDLVELGQQSHSNSGLARFAGGRRTAPQGDGQAVQPQTDVPAGAAGGWLVHCPVQLPWSAQVAPQTAGAWESFPMYSTAW